MKTAEIESRLSSTDWEYIRGGTFPFGTDEFRIPCGSEKETINLFRKIGGLLSWNEHIGVYVGVSKGHPLWDTICKMKS